MGLFNSISPEATIALGVFVGLISTCVQSIGLTLQRKSHMLEDEKAEFEVHRPAYKRRRWQVGMLLFLVANIVALEHERILEQAHERQGLLANALNGLFSEQRCVRETRGCGYFFAVDLMADRENAAELSEEAATRLSVNCEPQCCAKRSTHRS
jgi:hypothetical protein